MVSLLLLLGVDSSTALGQLFENDAPDPPPPVPQRAVVAEKELLIIDPAVVDSKRTVYPGAFSIGHLFDQMAGRDSDGRVLMRDWLMTWEKDWWVNDDLVKARPKMHELVLDPWREADGWDPHFGEPWLPNFKNAPFRLLAIVNRLDLGNLAPVYYGSNTSAEGRFVYGVIGADGEPLGHHFTVILEYKMMDGRGSNKQSISRQWHALGEHEAFDEVYLKSLEKLTRKFTDRVVDEEKELASGINQVRTNEMALATSCEMREYKFEPKVIALEPAPLAETPRMAFAERGSELNVQLLKYLRENQEPIVAGRSSLPEKIKRRGKAELPLLAGSCSVPDREFFWETGGVRTRELRRVFSRRTCNGCHARDTNTDFCHIRPRVVGKPSELSKFLSMDVDGFKVEDPGEFFHDIELNEMQGRVQDLLRSVHGSISGQDLRRLVKASLRK